MKQERKSGVQMRTNLLTSCATGAFPSFARVGCLFEHFFSVDANVIRHKSHTAVLNSNICNNYLLHQMLW